MNANCAASYHTRRKTELGTKKPSENYGNRTDVTNQVPGFPGGFKDSIFLESKDKNSSLCSTSGALERCKFRAQSDRQKDCVAVLVGRPGRTRCTIQFHRNRHCITRKDVLVQKCESLVESGLKHDFFARVG